MTGKNDCGSVNDGIRITELHDADDENPRKTVFIAPKYADDWVNRMEAWEKLVEKYGKLPTHADMDELLPYSEDEDEDEDEIEEYKIKYPKYDPCEKIMYLSKEYERMTDSSSLADIALIKIPKQRSNNRINSICYMASKSFKYDHFNQFFYMGGFGGKGHPALQGVHLSWYTGLNAKEIDNRFKNLTFAPQKIYSVRELDTFLLSNVDFVNGKIVTSRTCPGDSGGPAFVYGNIGNDQPIALLVGTLRGRDAIVSINI